MADKYIKLVATDGTEVPILLKDILGNGTQYGIAMSPASGSGGAITGPLDRRADAQSVSVAWSTEDVALITGRLAAAVAAGDALAKPTTSPIEAWLIGYNGATGDLVRVQSIRKDVATVAIGTIATVWTPTSGKKFRLMGGSISVSAACSVLFENNAAGAGNFIWRTPKLAADTPYNFDLGNGFLSPTIDHVLKATSSAAANLIGTLYGVEE
jgi:hypothetical protein